MTCKLRNLLIAFLVLFGINTVSFSVIGLAPNINQSVCEVLTGQTVAHAVGETQKALTEYKDLLDNAQLKPDFTSATGILTMVFKFATLFMGILGVLFVIILAVRVVVDLFIVALNWDIEDGTEISGVKGVIYSLSSFGTFGLVNGEGSKRVGGSYKFGSKRMNQIPEDVGMYVRDYWFSIVVSFICGGILLSGQIFVIANKGLDLASVVIDAFVNFDTGAFAGDSVE